MKLTNLKKSMLLILAAVPMMQNAMASAQDVAIRSCTEGPFDRQLPPEGVIGSEVIYYYDLQINGKFVCSIRPKNDAVKLLSAKNLELEDICLSEGGNPLFTAKNLNYFSDPGFVSNNFECELPVIAEPATEEEQPVQEEEAAPEEAPAEEEVVVPEELIASEVEVPFVEEYSQYLITGQFGSNIGSNSANLSLHENGGMLGIACLGRAEILESVIVTDDNRLSDVEGSFSFFEDLSKSYSTKIHFEVSKDESVVSYSLTVHISDDDEDLLFEGKLLRGQQMADTFCAASEELLQAEEPEIIYCD